MINVKNIRKKGEKVSGDDYIYASAMTRTRETHRINYGALIRMAEARDVAEICKMLSEYSVEAIYSKNGNIDAEETVNAYLAEEFRVIGKAMPQGAILNFLKASYDCHNLKSVIKCAAREGEDPTDLFIDLGTVPSGEVLEKVRGGKLSAFPKNIAISYEKAEKAFAESGDPKLIDAILDGACYADMLEIASSYRNGYFKKLVEIKIDTTNITTAVRVLRMGDTTGLFDSMFIKGGSLDSDFFARAMQSGENGLFSALKDKGYDFPDSDGISLTTLGRLCEAIYIKQVDLAKEVAFGAEVCVAYLIKASYATKMLRMVIAAKQTAVPSEKIKANIVKF